MILVEIKPTAEEWTERHLTVWCAWKHGWYGPDGLPTEAAAGENYSTLDRDSELAYDKLDAWIAESVENVINGLAPAQKAAIYRAYDVVAAFQFPRGNYQELLRVARSSVMAGLKRRGVWLGE